MLRTIGGVLALLALLTHAQGQSTATGAGDVAQKSKIRILAITAPPLADEQLPEGGLALALVNASLSRAGPGVDADSTVRWTNGALEPQALAAADFGLPVDSADCDHPNNLTQSSAVLCDNAVFSDPILQVVLALFTLSDNPFKFETDDSILGKTICLSGDRDLSALNGNGRNWAAYKRVTVMRRATLLDCVAAVQAHDADTFAAIDLEGTHLLRRLGLTPYFVMQPRPLATGAVHAVVARDHPRGADLINALNEGLKRLKESDAYSAIVQKQLMAAASTATVSSSRPEGAPPAPNTAAATSPAAGSSASANTAAARAASPTAPKPAAPVLDPASRETALKYLKRGNEELAEGRIAPARLLFERAAEMGLPQAAMGLAGTYDAAELNKPHLRNVLPDAAEARRWYERARTLGATEATARLQRLGSK
ncbi:MAG: transporter substrate-binding domain-containing protein [Hyphomicrobiaceae bacterium]|nr:transporter substrate-binding domain-containing protein [Hyphomicrobiaceae bacterium]